MFWKKQKKKSEREIEFGFDTTLYNEEAVKVAKEYEIVEWQDDLNDVMKERLRTELVEFIKTSGYTVGNVINGLVDAGLDEEKAALVAVTEITRVYAQAELLAGQQLQREFPDVAVIKTWYTNNDDLVCPICAPLNGMVVLLDQEFTDGIDAPPAHVNCRCWMSSRTDIGRDVPEIYNGD